MGVPYYIPEDKIPLPPPDADVFNIPCDYCIVACAYKAYRWPVGKEGGPKASENAFKTDFPSFPLGNWVSPNQHNIVMHKGKPHHVIVRPDKDTGAVNLTGDHSIRGGAIAQKCYNPASPTRDRLQRPLVRIFGTLMPVTWDFALDIAAEVSKHVIKNHGEHAFATKTQGYQGMEGQYAITRFSHKYINTPTFTWHDTTTIGPGQPGIGFAGFKTFSASYWDRKNADVLYIAGSATFVNATILFNEWILPGMSSGMKVIYANPRRTTDAALAEKNGGVWLDLYPGTDPVVNMAISRILLENDWVDKEFIKKWTNNKWDTESGFGRGTRNTPWQWVTTWGKLYADDFEDFKKWIMSQKESEIDTASKISGVSKDKIRKAAELLANGDGKKKVSFLFEKGLYWSNNYLSTASLGALALLTGCGNRPGRMIGRAGGHQRGGLNGASYPINKSPHKHPGRRRQAVDVDRYMHAGKIRLAWVVGNNWVNAMPAAQELMNVFDRLVRRNPHQVTSLIKEDIIETLKKRVDSGGTVVISQDIYLREPIGNRYSDIIFPVATWGETDHIRANGERRLRLYEAFYDPPGEAKPDWWIVAQWAKKMGFEGFDWKDANDVCEEGARFSRGREDNDYDAIAWVAKRKGIGVHDMIRKFGTTGIQTPAILVPENWEDNRPGSDYVMDKELRNDPDLRYNGEKITGMVRLHDSENADNLAMAMSKRFIPKKWMYAFNTQTGKAIFLKSPWDLYSDFHEEIMPKGDELWVTNGRVNEVWQSMFDDVQRRPYITQRYPDQIVEIHPDDARPRGIESGDMVMVWSDRIPVWKSSNQGVVAGETLYKNLEKNGHIKKVRGSYTGVAVVTDSIKKGVVFSNFLFPSQPCNSLSSSVQDPISLQPRYKQGIGRVKKIGESPYKRSFRAMSFAKQDVV